MSPAGAALIVGVGVLAGAMNAFAGGGTVLAFSVLMWLGLPPVVANATNALALWPGGFGAAWAFRRELARVGRSAWALVVPAAAGGLAGGILLLGTPPAAFRAAAPWLVLGASALIALEPLLRPWLRPPTREDAAVDPSVATRRHAIGFAVILAIAVYGGYFGAGLGILLLPVLGRLGRGDLYEDNALKNLLSAVMKGGAVAWFAARGAVDWPMVLLLAPGAIAGGYLGGAIARRVPEKKLRALIAAIGVALAAILFARA